MEIKKLYKGSENNKLMPPKRMVKRDIFRKEIHDKYNYVADPHGAVGYLGSKAYLKENPNAHCVFLETAHPVKFLDVVEEVVKEKQTLPPQIETVMHNKKISIKIGTYKELKDYLLK